MEWLHQYGDLCSDGRITVKCVLNEQVVRVKTGFAWIRIAKWLAFLNTVMNI
jgi:hypothetical protein